MVTSILYIFQHTPVVQKTKQNKTRQDNQSTLHSCTAPQARTTPRQYSPLHSRARRMLEQRRQHAVPPAQVRTLLVQPDSHSHQKCGKRGYVLEGQLTTYLQEEDRGGGGVKSRFACQGVGGERILRALSSYRGRRQTKTGNEGGRGRTQASHAQQYPLDR